MPAQFRSRTVDKFHTGTTIGQCFGQCHPHSAGRSVRDIAYRVEVFPRWASSHQNALTLQKRISKQDFSNAFEQIFRFRHTAFANQAGCQFSRNRIHDTVPHIMQPLKVGLGRWVTKHIVIHGRGYRYRAACRQYCCQQQIVAGSAGHGRQGIGGARGYQNQIGP